MMVTVDTTAGVRLVAVPSNAQGCATTAKSSYLLENLSMTYIHIVLDT